MRIVETGGAIKALAQGEILEIIAAETDTQKDIPSWCERSGQTLLSMTEDNGVFHYHVRNDR